MVEIGVRELKRDLSAYLRRAAAGEPVRVTMRGAPLVDLVRPEEGDRVPSPRAALIASGRLTPARRDHRGLASLLGSGAAAGDPHAALLAERAAERRRSSRRAPRA